MKCEGKMILLFIAISIVYLLIPLVFIWGGLKQVGDQNSELEKSIKRANKKLKK